MVAFRPAGHLLVRSRPTLGQDDVQSVPEPPGVKGACRAKSRNCPPRVYLTTMHPFHPDWETFADGDKWDQPDAWKAYLKSGSPLNPDAWGGHSDAADWDRHLGHVINIYDILLPYLASNGAIDDDNLGITESRNGIQRGVSMK